MNRTFSQKRSIKLPNCERELWDMDRFFNDQNLERLRSLASIATTEAERKILLGLLAEERVKFMELPERQNASA